MHRDPFTIRGLAVVSAAAVMVGLAVVPPLAASPELFPGSQIAVGMTGTGRTVVLGTDVSEFQIRVLGLLRNGGPAGDLVLFRASGPALQRVGGLAAGMSGSPIYLGGRLAGAFSYTFQAADPMVGLFTPIADMLKDLPASTAAQSPQRTYEVTPFHVDGRTIRRITLASRWASPGGRVSPDTLVAVPAATPLLVSGLSETGRQTLAGLLAPMGIVPMQGSGAANLPATLPLVPGSAIGVGLMQGEISAYAIGTLTYRDGNRVLAFGHPFTDIGHAAYLLTNATIFQTVRGQQQNIKVGAAGALVGTISEDRPAGIGGTIGMMPRIFGVRISVVDADAGTSRQFNFQVVNSKEIAPALVMLGAQEAIERALNRSGEGTAKVRMVLRGRALGRPVVRENLFYSTNDIATRALSEVPQAMHLMFENDFADVGPSDVQMDVRVTNQQQTAVITDVDMPTGPVASGGTLKVHVTLRPFRGSPQERDVELTVPPSFSSGTALLVVRAGGATLSSPFAGASFPSPSLQSAPRTLTDAFAAFEKGEKNTDVVVELLGTAPRFSPSGTTSTITREASTWTTPWVLRGRFQAPIQIEGGH
jgi:hypothetical protein